MSGMEIKYKFEEMMFSTIWIQYIVMDTFYFCEVGTDVCNGNAILVDAVGFSKTTFRSFIFNRKNMVNLCKILLNSDSFQLVEVSCLRVTWNRFWMRKHRQSKNINSLWSLDKREKLIGFRCKLLFQSEGRDNNLKSTKKLIQWWQVKSLRKKVLNKDQIRTSFFKNRN